MSSGNEGLWAFALRLYGAPGVSDACLVLQDESGVDVPVLLFSAWLASSSVAMTQSELARIDGLVKAWRDEVIKPLRAVRRRLKTGPHPAPGPQTEDLRTGVQAVELASEKIALALLEAEGAALAGAASGPAGDNLSLVVRYFREGEPDAQARQALAVIEGALAAL
jgi:uncharacterized protein (TIGR02444 family)